METAYSCKMLLFTYNAIWGHITEDHNRNHISVLTDSKIVIHRYPAQPDGILHCIPADDFGHCDVHR
jgi:hypothetical protein